MIVICWLWNSFAHTHNARPFPLVEVHLSNPNSVLHVGQTNAVLQVRDVHPEPKDRGTMNELEGNHWT
jgi:hypothetical protein